MVKNDFKPKEISQIVCWSFSSLKIPSKRIVNLETPRSVSGVKNHILKAQNFFMFNQFNFNDFKFSEELLKRRKLEMLTCLLLFRLGFKYSKITNIKTPKTLKVVESYMNLAGNLLETNAMDIVRERRKRRIVCVGGTEEVESVNAVIHQNVCGGGRHVINRRYSE